MAETQPYSDSEFYAVLRKIPNPSAARRHVIALLQAQLNPRIAYVNTQLTAAGWGAADLLKPMAPEVLTAPSKLTNRFINHAVVALTTDFETKPSQLVEANSVLSVCLIDRQLEDGQKIEPMRERGMVVIALLHRYIGGYYNSSSEKQWNEMPPVQMTELPEAWGDYSGVAVHYRLWQASGGVSNYWPAPVTP